MFDIKDLIIDLSGFLILKSLQMLAGGFYYGARKKV